jgi:hypothetical protein
MSEFSIALFKFVADRVVGAMTFASFIAFLTIGLLAFARKRAKSQLRVMCSDDFGPI